MKSQLTTPGIVGRQLNFTQIETMKCEILLLLRSSPTQAFNSEMIRRIVCGSDLGKLVEFAKALTRLEEQNEITIAILGTQMFIKLVSTADEAPAPIRTLPSQERPHIVRSKEEVHLTFCSGGCERVASGHCDCGKPLCNNCRYFPNGERSIFGDCSECSKVPQDRTEVYGSNGRAQ